MTSASVVEEYWSAAVSRLQAEVDVFNRLIGHQAEKGRENELSLVRLLESLLPQNVGVGSGIVIDSQGGRSKQVDIVLFDRATQPSVMAQTSQVLYPIEVVLATIEVKTTLSPPELEDCGVKRTALADLCRADGGSRPPFYVLGYHYSNLPANLATVLEGMANDRRPDAVCVVDPGIVAMKVGDGVETGLCALHLRDRAGARLPGWFKVFPALPTGGVYRFGESTLPVTRAPGGSIVACEPGRALLLFCEHLLKGLAVAANLGAPVLSHYLAGTAQETISLTFKP